MQQSGFSSGESGDAAEFERVLNRLSAINDDARLEQVLMGLMPKLVERLDTCTDAKAKKVLIEIVSHVTRWIKSPSKIKLPIVEIANVVKQRSLVSEKEGQAVRVAFVLLDIAFERSSEDDRIKCVTALLDVSTKLVDTQPQLSRLVLTVLPGLSLDTVERNLEWIADFAIDSCFPADFYFPSNPRHGRLALAPLGRQARTMDDNSNRALTMLTVLLPMCEKHDRPELKRKVYAPALVCSLICATNSHFRDDVRSLGEEGVRRLRNIKQDNDQREIVLNAVLDLILGNASRQKAPVPTRIKALELLGRLLGSQSLTSSVGVSKGIVDRVAKALISGIFGADQTVPIRIQTLQTLSQVGSIIPSRSPAEALLTSALKQQVSPTVIDQLTDDHRIALFQALSSWIASRRACSPPSSISWDASSAMQVALVLDREINPDAVAAEFQVLCMIGDDLRDVSLLVQSEILLEAVEFGAKPSAGKLKAFALNLARRVLQQRNQDSVSSEVPTSMLIVSCWILVLLARSFEPRDLRDHAKSLLNKMLSRHPNNFSQVFFSCESFLMFLQQRETLWIESQVDPPREYFYPASLRLLQNPSLLLGMPQEVLQNFVSQRGRLATGLCSLPLDGDFETKQLSCECLYLLLEHSLNGVSVDILQVLFDPAICTSPIVWYSKMIASPNEPLRRAAAKLTRFFMRKWPKETADLIVAKLRNPQCLFAECHGALAACGSLDATQPEAAKRIVTGLCEWLLDRGNEANSGNRELRDECFFSLRSIVLNLADRSVVAVVPTRALVERAREVTKNKSSEDDLRGTISFLGACAVKTSEAVSPADCDLAFDTLRGLSSDARFGLGSQQIIGSCLGEIQDTERLVKVIVDILEKSIFEESSLKTRSSAAILLERILTKLSRKKESREVLLTGGKDRFGLLDDLQDGLVELLGEPEEYTRLSAVRSLSKLFFMFYGEGGDESMEIEGFKTVREHQVSHLMRRFSLMTSAAKVLSAQVAHAFPLAPPPTTQQQNTSNTNATTTPTSASNQTPNHEETVRRPRLANTRRGNEERLWAFQDLATAAQQSGNASLVFWFLEICGGKPQESDDDDDGGYRSRGDSTYSHPSLATVLADISTPRLCAQFIRRRHFPTEDLTSRVAQVVFDVRLKRENFFESPVLATPVWNECSRLLRDSFLTKERRSACLTLSEIASKMPDQVTFVCSLEDAWRNVFRALDDLDESISNGPALALGRAIKRRTLIAINQQQQLHETEESKMEVHQLFAYLLQSGLPHTVKQARDLTRGFLVDSIAQKKLPDEFVCQVVEALLRTIGESESLTLQYAQFHTRGNGGTGELNIDAAKLEEVRARLALESPEYAATIKCASRLDNDVKLGKDLVQVVARVVRTGVGLVTLVAAVTLAGFLSSDEWKLNRLVLKDDEGLLKALTYKFAHDSSFELKRRIASSAAVLSRISAPSAVADYCTCISNSYDADPETSTVNRLTAASACAELVRRQVMDERLVRPCFLGRFDEDKQVAETWKTSWDMGLCAVLTQDQLVELCGKAINEYSYRTRRQGSEGLLSLPLFVVEKASHGQMGLDLLRQSTNAAIWEGKETLCRACGTVFAACSEPDLVEYASLEFGNALFLVNDTTSESGSAKTPRPKWLWEALFEAQRKIFTNKLLSAASKERFLRQWVEKVEIDIPNEPLVRTAALRCAREAFEGEGKVSGASAVSCIQVISRILTQSPTWNVVAAALDMSASSAYGWFASGNPAVSEIGHHLEKILREEKKPAVLLTALRLLNVLVDLLKSSPSVPTLELIVKECQQQSLDRLEGNADPNVGRLANEIKSKLTV